MIGLRPAKLPGEEREEVSSPGEPSHAATSAEAGEFRSVAPLGVPAGSELRRINEADFRPAEADIGKLPVGKPAQFGHHPPPAEMLTKPHGASTNDPMQYTRPGRNLPSGEAVAREPGKQVPIEGG